MPFQRHSHGLTVRIKLTPGARKTGFQGLADMADDGTAAGGGRLLKIAVNVVPEGGKANRALLAFLADEWGIAKSALSLLSGDTSRIKAILVQTDHPDVLLGQLRARHPEYF